MLVLEVNARNAAANAIATVCAAGSANPTPRMLIKTSTGTTLATLLMSVPPFGAASNGSITSGAIQADTNAAASGTMASYEIVNRDNQRVLTGTITAVGGGGDAVASRLNIAAGDTVAMSGVYTITVSP